MWRSCATAGGQRVFAVEDPVLDRSPRPARAMPCWPATSRRGEPEAGDEALRHAVACGIANTQSGGAGQVDARVAGEMAENVSVRELG